MCFEAYKFRKKDDDVLEIVHADNAVACSLGDRLYECKGCANELYLRLESVDEKRRHFAHGPNTSCDGSFSASESRSANQAEITTNKPGWFKSWTTVVCKPSACNVRLSKGIVADVLGVGGNPIFVQRAPITKIEMQVRTAEVAKLKLRPIWILQSTVTSFRDITYAGADVMLVTVDNFEIGDILEKADVFVDGSGQETLVRVRAVGDGHVYKHRNGAGNTVDVGDVLRDVYGEDALRVPLGDAVKAISMVQPRSGKLPEHDFIDWRSWMEAATPGFDASARGLDAHKAWVEIHARNGMSTNAWKEMPLLEGGEPPGDEQRAAISNILGNHRTVLEGAAGVGKTVVLRAVANAFTRMGFRTMCMGSTNRASIALDGVTVHSFCGLVTRPAWLSPRLIRKTVKSLSDKKLATIRSYAVLIGDEYAMLCPEVTALLHAVLCYARGNTLPFGGCIVILSGNVDQLPAVSTAYGDRFFFERAVTAMDVFRKNAENNVFNTQKAKDLHAEIMAEAQHPKNAKALPNVMEFFQNYRVLRHNHRQHGDPRFQSILHELASTGGLGIDSRRILAERVVEYDSGPKPEVMATNVMHALGTPMPRIIAQKKDTVGAINTGLSKDSKKVAFELAMRTNFPEYSPKRKLDGELVMTKEEFYGLQDQAKCRAAEMMEELLKAYGVPVVMSEILGKTTERTYTIGLGTMVILLERVGDLPKHTVGTLIDGYDDGTAMILVGGVATRVPPQTIEIPCYNAGSADITYTPIEPIGACTVHKSQGATIFGGVCIILDATRWHRENIGTPWPCNMGYTALTRCKSLDNLTLMVDMREVRMNRRSPAMTIDELIRQVFRIHPKVMKFKRDHGFV